MDGGVAHGAWLAAGVDLAVGALPRLGHPRLAPLYPSEVVDAQLDAGGPNHGDLGVGGGVAVLHHVVVVLPVADDLVGLVVDLEEDGAEGPAPRPH